ncbi:hypothetical protein SEVIR_7G245950v4 [Setaria viridis]|uniref:Protein kinase domain-containing protein n=1 Tax=Setaria viridis TaxID=4556 RepID=A0A4U6TY13_SETVI|nr:hypothetical protein SEVIR_7G245950v2 [Setaria viridis]
MEWCDSCLSEKIGASLDPLEALEMLYQVSKGLDFIHGGGIAHLDVKPDNMYRSNNGVYKLGDFGCAEFTSIIKEGVEGGDRRYMPAEILNGGRCEHLDKVDIFSLGASTYELVRGQELPREGDEFNKLRMGNLDLPPKSQTSLGV